jgi:hypothetical protein
MVTFYLENGHVSEILAREVEDMKMNDDEQSLMERFYLQVATDS